MVGGVVSLYSLNSPAGTGLFKFLKGLVHIVGLADKSKDDELFGFGLHPLPLREAGVGGGEIADLADVQAVRATTEDDSKKC
ncbi:MAG: hypothetical protein KF799_09970 [Bdellovibrionales bacterium]|nr:hypothetical protein [Bdellovibrionales bacterium]